MGARSDTSNGLDLSRWDRLARPSPRRRPPRRGSAVWVLAGVALLIAAPVFAFFPLLPVSHGTVSSGGTLAYPIVSAFGPVWVDVAWTAGSGSPAVSVSYCDPAPSAGSTCPNPVYLHGPRAGSPINGSVPAGGELFVSNFGPANSTAVVTVSESAPTLAVVLGGAFALLATVGGILRRRRYQGSASVPAEPDGTS